MARGCLGDTIILLYSRPTLRCVVFLHIHTPSVLCTESWATTTTTMRKKKRTYRALYTIVGTTHIIFDSRCCWPNETIRNCFVWRRARWVQCEQWAPMFVVWCSLGYRCLWIRRMFIAKNTQSISCWKICYIFFFVFFSASNLWIWSFRSMEKNRIAKIIYLQLHEARDDDDRQRQDKRKFFFSSLTLDDRTPLRKML